MGYQKVYSIEEVSVGRNYVVGGAITIRLINEELYIYVDGKYYKFSSSGYECNKKFESKIFEYGGNPINILGKFIAYKLILRGKHCLHITINLENDTPFMIYQEVLLDEDEEGNINKNINFCYRPKEVENSRGYNGVIGYVNKDLYLVAYNKSRLLNKSISKVDYVKKAKALLSKIEKCNYLPLAYKVEHEDIYIPGIFPSEMNKLYYLSKLRNIITNYSNGMIYYSESYKRLEIQYKEVLNYFKYEVIAS